jgi:origin recognition complex subunit 4
MPKRKAQEDIDAAEPSPPKRATRASARRNESELVAPSRSSTRIGNSPQKDLKQGSSVRKRSAADTQLGASIQPPRTSRVRKKQPAASESPPKKTESSSPSKRNEKQNFNPIAIPHEQEVSGDADEADELNLSPSKPAVRCTTPPPSLAGRVLMHSVEISTPRAFPKLLSTASPAPSARHSTAKARTISTVIADNVPGPVTTSPRRPPTLRDVLPPQTPNRHTKQLANIPSRDKPQSKSPKKLPTSRPQSPTRIPRNLPPHLGTCLRLQKRAMLAELQNCSMEGDGDVSLGPTNTAAFQQLKDLLVGTASRGEGNSCFVLGPRGSGKTTVSRLHLPVFYILSPMYLACGASYCISGPEAHCYQAFGLRRAQ